jgi:MFS family permease
MRSISTATQKISPWSPLRHSLFRALWIAAVASNVGTWMQNVGAEWLMTTLAPRPIMLGLMQAAENAPLFLLALPAGALADILDRRRLLLVTQAWMLVAAVALGFLTLFGLTTPWVLLALTFLLGLGAALNAPAWQAIVPELVDRDELPLAISLNSVAFNIARAVGPALGGLIVAAAGPWAVFFLNSASFIGVLFVLYRWRRRPIESISPAERVMGAMRAGLRYVRHAPDLKAVLVRTAVFGACASALWALLPLVAGVELGRGAFGYGMLLGGLGLGAIAAAMILPTLRRRLTINRLVVVGSLIFAFTTFTLAIVQSFILLCLVMIIGGIAWMSVMSSFNIGVQTIVPEWVRARALAIYLLVFYGSLTGGSLIWGAVANRIGIRDTLLSAAAMLVVGLLVGLRYRMRIGGELNLEPSLHWTEPAVVVEPELDAGPVLVLTEYQIDPKDSLQFLETMAEMGRIYQRDGASQWGVFHDPAFPGRYMNTFLVESWAEHLRQHARVTMEDRAVQQRARAFHKGDSPPRVSHLIAEDTRKFRRRRNGLR